MGGQQSKARKGAGGSSNNPQSSSAGPTSSKYNPSGKKPMTVGQTERNLSRAKRMKEEKKKQQGSLSAGDALPGVPHEPPKLDDSGRLTQEEVVRRSMSSVTTKTLVLGTPENPISLEYAHWTQRGYYPDDPHKENQDDFSVTAKFGGSDRDVFFAVYDGHGKKGHDCARFAKKKLPNAVAKYLRQARVKKYQEQIKNDPALKGRKAFDPQNWPLLDPEEYKMACKKAFLEVNKDMHRSPDVEDNISGTTAISVSLHGTLLTVCNVGDSRAVLGHGVDFQVETSSTANTETCKQEAEEVKEEIGEETDNDAGPDQSKKKEFPPPGNILAVPLSRDQTPYRKDERERVKRKGAAIMSIDQMEGKEEMHENWGDMVLGEDVDIHGDPPRVWVEGKDYPGTAFTRSVGDSLAEGIGVTAEPEILSRHVTSNDHLLIIASDGIFEFLTNQEVIDLAAQCSSPIIACEQLVKQAYNQWLTYEDRTDDITIIVCFLNVDKEPPEEDGETGTTEDLVELAKSMYGNKPVRKIPRGVNDNLSSGISADGEEEVGGDGTSPSISPPKREIGRHQGSMYRKSTDNALIDS